MGLKPHGMATDFASVKALAYQNPNSPVFSTTETLL